MAARVRFRETWRVPRDRSGREYIDYEVSTLGRVRRITSSRPSLAGKFLKPIRKSTGYLAVNLYAPAGRRMLPVHELVCASFRGVQPRPGMVVCHNDGNKEHNALDNLRWGTPRENASDALRHGHVARGERHGRGQAKLSVPQVARIRGLLLGRARTSDLARIFAVSENAIAHIKYGRTWPEVPPVMVRERSRPAP